MKNGFFRVSCATPKTQPANCKTNTENILKLIHEAYIKDCSFIVFPEMCVTSYTCYDLLFHKLLLDDAEKSVEKICEDTKSLDILIALGVPVLFGSSLLNCACLLYHGEILGIVPKSHLPNYSEFSEKRYFSTGPSFSRIYFANKEVDIGTDIIFACKNIPNLKIGIEICEDLWSVIPPSSALSLAGATVIANLSASNEIIGKGEYRKSLVKGQSARTMSAYLYSSAGISESTSDTVFSGHNMIVENGVMLEESEKLLSQNLIYADIDLELLVAERQKNTEFVENKAEINYVWFNLPLKNLSLSRKYNKFPFMPNSSLPLNDTLEDVVKIQSTALAMRLNHINCSKAVLGISGGLDSTLALIVTARAFDMLNLDHNGIITVTMPGFGTTNKTYDNACKLCSAYGTTIKEINIKKAVTVHLEDIGHDVNLTDTTYENAQARERTQILMDLANMENAIVIGTGDLSELALGFSTYNGDHMSMYNPNASVPKTLIRHVIEHVINTSDESVKSILVSIINTPVSPELLPPEDGGISQKTETIVGPYELNDFFLYYLVRYSFNPKKIFRICMQAFSDIYSAETIKKWLVMFFKRFFSSQFKRSCSPDSPKIGSVSLSSKTDFKIVSDISANMWIKEAKEIEI